MKQQVYVAKQEVVQTAGAYRTTLAQLPIDVGAPDEIAHLHSCRIILRADWPALGGNMQLVGGGIFRRSEGELRNEWFRDSDVIAFAEFAVYADPNLVVNELMKTYDFYWPEPNTMKLIRRPQIFVTSNDPVGGSEETLQCVCDVLAYYTIHKISKEELTKLMVKDRE
jgi:hypothetical protein